jgi:hypothetical protein
VGNRDGPVAHGLIYIKSPENMLPDDTNTHNSPVEQATYRCEGFSHGSDYEIAVLVKPMNTADRTRGAVP